jgi:hypothetical protein
MEVFRDQRISQLKMVILRLPVTDRATVLSFIECAGLRFPEFVVNYSSAHEIRMLMSNNINRCDKSRHKSGLSPLIAACMRGNAGVQIRACGLLEQSST